MKASQKPQDQERYAIMNTKRVRSTKFWLVCVFLGLVIWCLAISQQVWAGPLSEWILFSVKLDSTFKIYKVRPDGRELELLVSPRSSCREPNLCSTTNQVVFSLLDKNRWTLCTTSLEGESICRLEGSKGNDRHPSWSPDGKQIVFDTDRWGQKELAIINSDGQNLRRLTYDQTGNSHPTWSPDGQSIAFVSWCNGPAAIYVINPEVIRARRRLANHGGINVSPAWSPDSQHIVFNHRSVLSKCLAIADCADGRIRRLANTQEYTYPAWSPNGDKLLVVQSKQPSELKTVDPLTLECQAFPAEVPGPVYDLVWQRSLLPWQANTWTSSNLGFNR